MLRHQLHLTVKVLPDSVTNLHICLDQYVEQLAEINQMTRRYGLHLHVQQLHVEESFTFVDRKNKFD